MSETHTSSGGAQDAIGSKGNCEAKEIGSK
jgi:hypothetical protein